MAKAKIISIHKTLPEVTAMMLIIPVESVVGEEDVGAAVRVCEREERGG